MIASAFPSQSVTQALWTGLDFLQGLPNSFFKKCGSLGHDFSNNESNDCECAHWTSITCS